MTNLYEDFARHFDVVPADTIRLIEAAYRLRYQVYCQENSYEDATSFPDQMEFDEYDLHSPQSMVRCRVTGHHAGLVRLVLANPVDASKPFPVEKYCNLYSSDAANGLSEIPRDALAEISRFSISKAMKGKCLERPSMRVVGGSDIASGDVACNQNRMASQRMLPLMTIGLFAGIVRMSSATQYHPLACRHGADLAEIPDSFRYLFPACWSTGRLPWQAPAGHRCDR